VDQLADQSFVVRHGAIPELKVAEFALEGTGAAVEIETTRSGNEITGQFTLSFQGYETDPIAFDASPEEMQERLEALASVATVEVTRSDGAITNPGGFVWVVTFTSDSNAADQELIESSDALLSGSGKTITIIETTKGSQVNGNFTLSYEGNLFLLLLNIYTYINNDNNKIQVTHLEIFRTTSPPQIFEMFSIRSVRDMFS
jgi:hypothetical protein